MPLDIIAVVILRSQWLAKTLIAFSLALSISLAVSWAWTFVASDQGFVWSLFSSSRESEVDIGIDRVSLVVRRIHWLDTPQERQQFLRDPAHRPRQQSLDSVDHRTLGFELVHGEYGVWNNVGLMWAGHIYFYLAFPVALTIPLLLVYPAIRLRRILRFERANPHSVC
jgi:hypothetical protein